MRTMARFRAWYADFFGELGLTLGGRIAFTIIFLLGVLLGAGGVVGHIATDSENGGQLAAVLLVFLGVFLLLALMAVVAVDAGFRVLRVIVRRLARRPHPS